MAMSEIKRNGPKVSVGMPVFNGERYIREAIESILSQSFEQFELVISDNASTDGTPEICQDYAARDGRIRYVRHPENAGVIKNFNAAFDLSTGEYFKWAASDDVCGRDYLLRAVAVLDNDPSIVLVWGRTVGIDENGSRVPMRYEISDLNSSISVYSPDPAVRFRRLLRNIWWVDGPFYGVIRSSALRDTRWVHPPHHSGDQILLSELSLKGRFYEIPEELFFSRVHKGKTSHAHRSLRDRVALVDQRDPGSGAIASLRAMRAYPRRIWMYASAIAWAPIPVATKLRCAGEVPRAIAHWVVLRGRQLRSGQSPWR
jgi:glycosyltransferase involved in cell wall biosynthesis